MKKKKTKIFMSISVLFICFLISSSSLNTLSTKALSEGENNLYNTDSFDKFTWKWNTTEIVSTESTSDSRVGSLAVDALGNVHIAWMDTTNYDGSGGDWDVFYKRWEESSYSWTTTEVVSTESIGASGYPSLAVDTLGNVHIAWQDISDYDGSGSDYDIFYKRWEDSTSSWTTTEVVSTESTEYSEYPSLAVDTLGNVHIAWQDSTNYAGAGADEDIFYKRWEASSSSWTTTEVVSTESPNGTFFPSIAVDTLGNVHIAWEDWADYAGAGTDEDIFYKQWEASSSSWKITEVVSTESTGVSFTPSLAVDALGNVHIAWMDNTNYAGSGGDVDIFYKRWEDSSSSWTTTDVVSTESISASEYPSLAVDTLGNVHIAWYDTTDYAGSGTDEDIFYKRWEDSTSSWTTTEVVSTENIGISGLPSLAVDSIGNVHIAWDDSTDYTGAGTDWDIFYKLLAGPPAAPELAFIIPNPTDIDAIYLDWNNITRTTSYHVYRHTYYIWSVENLYHIASVTGSAFLDTLPAEGFYYYVIVASNFAGNSSHSNCQYVEYKIPHVREFTIVTGLVLVASALVFVVTRIRKKNSKMN